MGAPGPKHVSLGIGEIIISPDPIVVSTVLGSCISVCIYALNGSIGGINHFVLPYNPSKQASAEDEEFRYGDRSTRTLIETILEHSGLRPQDLRAKIIGGASTQKTGIKSSDIGKANAEAARRILERYGIPLVGSDLGGDLGRKIYFYTASGQLRMSYASSQAFVPPVLPVGSSAPASTLSRGEPAKKSSLSLVAPAPLAAAPASAPGRNEAPIKVLIVDDSKTVQDVLKHLLSEDPGLQVVGVASSAREAEAFLAKNPVDVMTLDIHMPEMDGVSFLEKLLPVRPLPVVMVTAMSLEDGGTVLRALELGAVDYIQKPKMTELAVAAPQICEKVKAAASARLMKRRPALTPTYKGGPKAQKHLSCKPLVAIGSSTGGTEALKQVLLRLSADIPPIVIVQHIPPVFSRAFAERLNVPCPFEVKEGEDGDELLAGRVIIAPGGKQMNLRADGYGYRIQITDAPPVNRHKPSVDVLFDSVAKLAPGKAIGIILTGMGADGAQGLKNMHDTGCPTIAQDEKSSVVFGMPREAIRLGAAGHICDIADVAAKLEALLKK